MNHKESSIHLQLCCQEDIMNETRMTMQYNISHERDHVGCSKNFNSWKIEKKEPISNLRVNVSQFPLLSFSVV